VVLMEPALHFNDEVQGIKRVSRMGQKDQSTCSFKLVDIGSQVEREILEKQEKEGQFHGKKTEPWGDGQDVSPAPDVVIRAEQAGSPDDYGDDISPRTKDPPRNLAQRKRNPQRISPTKQGQDLVEFANTVGPGLEHRIPPSDILPQATYVPVSGETSRSHSRGTTPIRPSPGPSFRERAEALKSRSKFATSPKVSPAPSSTSHPRQQSPESRNQVGPSLRKAHASNELRTGYNVQGSRSASASDQDRSRSISPATRFTRTSDMRDASDNK
jgi:hypothetical protein